MDNVNFEELFGLEAQETPDNQQDPTQEQPAVEQKEAPVEEQKEAPVEQTAEEQSKEERARQAFARRIREAEERGARAERERANAIIEELDLDDPDNEGQKVSDLDKAAQYISRRRRERFATGNPTEADIKAVVQEQFQQRQQPPVPQGLSPEDKAEMDRQLGYISKMDPAMKDLNAILTSDIGPAFRQYVGQGDDFVTSFYKAKELQFQTQQQAAAAEKAKAASKGHLISTRQQGEGALSVPAEDMAYFRELMPDATAEEIQKYYNADRKRYGPK